jgi:hypothetical protein
VKSFSERSVFEQMQVILRAHNLRLLRDRARVTDNPEVIELGEQKRTRRRAKAIGVGV